MNSILAQHVGFTLDGTGMITNAGSRIIPVPVGFSIIAGYDIIEDLDVEGRVGYQVFMIEYAGLDIALLINYKVVQPVYAIAGFMHHSNEATYEEGVKMAKANFIGIGAGVEIFRFMSFDLIYFQALKKEPWIGHHDLNWTQFWTEDLKSVIRADLKFSWDL
jgi:hypothetical protein